MSVFNTTDFSQVKLSQAGCNMLVSDGVQPWICTFLCSYFYLCALELMKSRDDVIVQQNNIVTCFFSWKPNNQRPLYCTDVHNQNITETCCISFLVLIPQLTLLMFVWYHVKSRCLFVTYYCCIEYDVIIDCNEQVLVTAIKKRASFCSHGQTCVFLSQCNCICGLYVGGSVSESILTWLNALCMMSVVHLRSFLELHFFRSFFPGIISWRNSKVVVFFCLFLNPSYRIHKTQCCLQMVYNVAFQMNSSISQEAVKERRGVKSLQLFCCNNKVGQRGETTHDFI